MRLAAMVRTAVGLSLDVAFLVLWLSAKFSVSQAQGQGQRPIHAAASLFFKDIDELENHIDGSVVWRRARDETDITHYSLYWAASDTKTDATAITSQVAHEARQQPSCTDTSRRRRRSWAGHRRRRTPQCNRVAIDDHGNSWHIARSRSGYQNHENAQIYVEGPGTVEVAFFNTERNYDFLRIGNSRYSGTPSVPFTVELSSGQHLIHWTTDRSISRSGWELTFTPQSESGEYLTWQFSSRTMIPQGTTHLLLFSANTAGEMNTGVGFPILDNVSLPTPQGLNVVDTDSRHGILSGEVDVLLTTHSSTDHIDLSWGVDSTRRLGPCSGVAGYVFDWSIDDCSGYNHHLETMSAPFAPVLHADANSRGLLFDGDLVAQAASSWRLKLHNFTVMAWVMPLSISQADIRLVGKGEAQKNNYGAYLIRGGMVQCKVDRQCFQRHYRYSPLNMPGQARSFEASALGCQARCARVSGCMHFSFRDGGDCYLQNSNAQRQHIESSSQPWTAGPKQCNNPPVCHTQDRILSHTWSHVACTYDGEKISVYVNKTLKQECPWVGIPEMTDDSLTLGGMNVESAKFDGIMDDVHVNDRALSAYEIDSFSVTSRITNLPVTASSSPFSTVKAAMQGVSVPAGATHLLAFSMKGSWDSSVPISKPILAVDTVVPTYKPKGIFFQDSNAVHGLFSGYAFVEKAERQNSITHYNLYWGTETGKHPTESCWACRVGYRALDFRPPALGGRTNGPCTTLEGMVIEKFKLDSLGGNSEQRQNECRARCRALTLPNTSTPWSSHWPAPAPATTTLMAYWDSGSCGPQGDDHNWEWCGRTAFNCQQEVSTSQCANGVAYLVSTSGDGTCCSSVVIDGCSYAYFARYSCTAQAPAPHGIAPAPTPTGIKGCELVYDGWDQGCYAHMNYVRGSNVDGTNRYCWAVPSHRIAENPFLKPEGVREGRLEVFNGHSWGTVCDSAFEDVDAGVACRHMGYEDGSVKPSSAVSDGSGSIHLSDLPCEGTEGSLFDCVTGESQQTGTPSGSGSSCTHVQDVGISCVGALDLTSSGPSSLLAVMLPSSGRPTEYGTHIVAVSAYEEWDMDIGVSMEVPDFAPPMALAASLTFTDTDRSTGQVAGVVNITTFVALTMTTTTALTTSTLNMCCQSWCSSYAHCYWAVCHCCYFCPTTSIQPGLPPLATTTQQAWLTTMAQPWLTTSTLPPLSTTTTAMTTTTTTTATTTTTTTTVAIRTSNTMTTTTTIPTTTHQVALPVCECRSPNGVADAYRNGASPTDSILCMQTLDQAIRPCYPYTGLCNPDWTKCDNTQVTTTTTTNALEACKSWCADSGYCCTRHSGCQRPSCIVGCEVRSTALSTADCLATCELFQGTCSGTPSGYPTAYFCTAGHCQCAGSFGPGNCEPNAVNACAAGCTAVQWPSEITTTQAPPAPTAAPAAPSPPSWPAPPAAPAPPSPPTQVCADNPSFRDERGFRCSGWAGYRCDRAVSTFFYTQHGQNQILQNCRLSCGLCQARRMQATTDGVCPSMVQYMELEGVGCNSCDLTSSAQACAQSCMDSSSCLGVTYDSHRCRFHNGPGPLTLKPSTWTNNQYKHWSCIKSGFQSAVSTTTPSGVTTTTTKSTTTPQSTITQQVTRYNIYWADNTSARLVGEPALGSVAYHPTGPTLFQVPEGTNMPEVATQIIVFAEGQCHGSPCEAVAGSSVQVVDWNMQHVPRSVSFVDSDNMANRFGGTVTVKRAPNENPITSYDVYWGAGEAESSSAAELSLLTNIAKEPPTQSIVVKMIDQYGDGWNGNQYTIRRNGITISTGTLTSGSLAYKTISNLVAGEAYTISVGGGTWQREVSWQVLLGDRNGQVLVRGRRDIDAIRDNVIFRIPGDSVSGLVYAPDSISWIMAQGSVAASGATHLLAFAVQGAHAGGARYGASVLLEDRAPPAVVAQAVNFEDRDSQFNLVSGTIEITRASQESHVSHYVVYWGQSATEKLGVQREPGLNAEFFYFRQGNTLPQLDGRSPSLTRVDMQVNYANTGSRWTGLTANDHYAGRWTGHIEIVVAGDYTFSIGCDDGCSLTVNDAVLVELGGRGAFRWRSATQSLSTGFHSIRLLHFEVTGHAGFILKYRGPDTGNANVVVPASKLWHGLIHRDFVGNVSTSASTTATLEVQMYNGTAIPNSSTHLLVFAASHQGESPSGVSILIRDYVVPSSTAASIVFQDTNPVSGSFGGMITIMKASNGLDITHYLIYWGSSPTAKIPNTEAIAWIYTNATTTPHLTVSAGAARPNPQATHFVAISAYDQEEMAIGVGVAVADYAPPMYTAQNVTFHDVDGAMNEIGGAISIQGASDESGFWGYRAYWGRSHSERLEGGNPGFLAEYFWWSSGLSRLPLDLDQRSPDVTRTDLSVDYPINRRGGAGTAFQGLARRDRFASRWTGSLQISTADLYRFRITSDDGSMLKIDDIVVVDNDGRHANRARQGNAQLEVGAHNILLTHFENAGGATMVFEYKGADTGNIWVVVPSTAVRHGVTARPPIGNVAKNGGVATISVPPNTLIPTGGTHFLVYAVDSVSATPEGESTVCKAAAATDIVMPEHAAEGLELVDTDRRQGFLDGVLTITRAAVETQITHYQIYWGTSSTAKLSSLAPLASVAPSASSNLRLWSLSNKAWLHIQGRPCSQSSTGWGGVCSRGIDGNSNSDYFGARRRRHTQGSCTHTGHPGRNGRAWWKVTLPANYSVQRLSVTNRGDCCGDRLNGFDVLVDENTCASDQQISQGATKLVVCSAQGSELKIRGRRGQYLTLCEVKVYGSAQADYQLLHGGKCAGGVDDISLFKNSSGDCASECGAESPACYYFSYRSTGVDSLGHNCVLHVSANGCPADLQHPDYSSYRISGAQAIPTGASHLLVFSAYNGSEMVAPAALQFTDFYPPSSIPRSVNFTDQDTFVGTVSGVVLVTPPLSETGLTEYRVYWGMSPSQKVEAGTPGLLAEFFCIQQRIVRIPSLTGLAACHTRIDEQVNYGGTHSNWPGLSFKYEFAARWTGFVRIQEEGDYTFYINSDDGSRLYIDDEQVVDNDNLHPMRRASGTKLLSAGHHSLKLLFFQNWGHAGMILEYRGPDTANNRVVVPKTALLHGSLDNSIGSVSVNGDGAARPVQIAFSTQIPSTATHLLAFSVGASGESTDCASVPIADRAVPVHPAGSISFTDNDVTRYVLGGNISVERAANESDVTHYNIYWGTNSTSKLQEMPLASLAAVAGSGSAVGGCGTKGMDTTPFSAGRRLQNSAKVINGQDANECEWRWQVDLVSTSSGQSFCAGTLISPRWVLTSAVCTRNTGTSFRVVAGSFDKRFPSSQQQTRDVELVISHPSFSSTTMDYDYSLVKLSSEFAMTSCVAPACLPVAQAEGGEECFVTGWGKTTQSGGMSHTLREAKVVTLTNEACSARVTNPAITAQMLCAQGTSSSGSSTCQGDRGSPLVCTGGDHYAVQGVTSWGDGCASNQFPGVYARISEILPWIAVTAGVTPPSDSVLFYSLNATIPAGATHFLVFTSYNGGEMATPAAMEFVDYYPPTGAPVGLEFVDMDATTGEVSGVITVQRSDDESGVTAYKLYWGVDASQKTDLIGEVSPSAPDITLEVEANTPIPAGATHILAYTSSQNGESLTCASAVVVDLDKSLVSGGLAFVDVDSARLKVGGVLTLQRALEEQTLRQYNVYWGQESTGCQKLVARALASVPVTVQFADPECTDGGACVAGLIDISLVGTNSWVVSRGGDTLSYTSNERATVVLSGPGMVRFKRMSTESGYDTLTVAGQDYSGQSLPADIAIVEGPHQVVWYSDGTVTMEGWAFEFTKTMTAGSLYQTLPLGIDMPASATHLLVYSQLIDGSEEDALCAREAVPDFAPPRGIPDNITFSDTDANLGRIGGIISVTRARDEFLITSYRVWWGAGDQILQGDKPMLIAQLNVTTAGAQVLETTLVDGTIIPTGATHLVVFCAGDFGQSQDGASIMLWDFSPPTSTAQALEFVDTDPRSGMLGGVASITLATDHTGITTYNLYWAIESQKLDLIVAGQPLWSNSPVCNSDGLDGNDCSLISITERASGVWEISRGTATYGSGEKAFVYFQGPAMLSFTFFNTERHHDTLDVLGTLYSGTSLPPDTAVPPGSHHIQWTTDFENSGVGWICALTYSTSEPLEVLIEPNRAQFSATHLLVLTAGNGGEMTSGFATPLQDYAPPVEKAESVEFDDVDLGIGTVGGEITIARASTGRDVNVTHFQVFWGAGPNSSLEALPEAANVSDQSASHIVLVLQNGVVMPVNATHLLVFAANQHGRAVTSISTRIVDAEGLGFSPSEITLTGVMSEVSTVDVVISNEHTQPINVNMQIDFEGSGADASRDGATSGAGASSARASEPRGNIIEALCTTDDSTNRVLFKWKASVPEQGRRLHERRLSSSHGLVKLHMYDKIDMQYAEILSDGNSNASSALLEDLLKMPDVEWAEKDSMVFLTDLPQVLKSAAGMSPQTHMMRKITPKNRGDVTPTFTYTPSDTELPLQWAFQQTNDADIDAPEAWSVHTGDSRHVVVAVIDSGVDYNHVDLVGQMWTNPGEIPDNGIDEDNNGLVDDYHGYNFKEGPSNVDPLDDLGHGTHIAGTLGAEANNDVGIAGVSWGVQIMALRFLGETGGTLSKAIESLDYAISKGAQISVNAWGSPYTSQALRQAIQRARDHGHLFVTAAGNNGKDNDAAQTPWYPCNYDLDNIICVAATDQNDDLARFSNWGATSVHLAAPGQDIYSTSRNNQYSRMSGTSMAVPFVGGAAALIWDYVPTLTYSDVKDIIVQTGDQITKLTNLVFSGKRLNLYNAIQGARSLQWARIQGGNSSVTVPPQSGAELGEARITLELGGERMVAGEYHASLKLWVGELEQRIPIVLLLHNFSGIPAVGAQAVSFDDVNDENGIISGALTITRAAQSAEEQISQYHIFWGNSSTHPISGLPPIAILDSGSVFRDEFVAPDTTFWQVSSGAGVTYSGGHVRFAGKFEVAQLSFARRVAAPFTLKARIKRGSAFAGMVIQISGTGPRLFRPGGGIQAVVAGNYKYLEAEGSRQTVQCLGRLWYEVTISMRVDSVSFADNQDCETLVAQHSIEGPQHLLIGADCTGSCPGSDWDFFEISGGAYAVYNVENALVPAAATHILVYAWNPVGMQDTAVSCLIDDLRSAIRADTPSNVSASSPAVDSLSVHWIRGSMNECQFRGWRVTVRAASATAWSIPVGCETLIDMTLTSCTATGLTSNSGYLFKVQVLCSRPEADSLESAASLAVKTLPKPALSPTWVSASAPTAESLRVTWRTGKLEDCEFTQSVVEAQSPGTGWFSPSGCQDSVRIQDKTCVAEGLDPNTEYEFRVYTVCSNRQANSPRSVPSTSQVTRLR